MANKRIVAHTISDTEVIARQARKLEMLENELEDRRDRMHRALSVLISVPGALNGNVLGYSDEQRRELLKIEEQLHD